MLTETQLAALRPKWNEYPERRVLVPMYPPARRKRGLTTGQQAGLPADDPGALPNSGLGDGPNVTLWTLNLQTNTANTLLRRGSQRFKGPALIHSFTGVIQPPQVGTVIYPVQVAYSTSPYTDTDVGGAWDTLPGTHIFLASDPYPNAGATAQATVGMVSDISASIVTVPLGVYVSAPEFYLGVAVFTAGAVTTLIRGMFRVIENAPPESVAWI